MQDDEVAALRQQLEQANRALVASEERFRSVIARNADAIVLVDRAGRVCFVNPAAEQLFRQSAEQLVGSVFGFPTLEGETSELDLVDARGEPRVAEMRVVQTTWEGEPGYLASLRDITDRKRAEEERAALYREQAARAEAEAALKQRDEFLSVASHELKTPITSLHAYAQLLARLLARDGGLEPQVVLRATHTLEEQSNRVARLVTLILDVARIQAGDVQLQLVEADVPSLVREAIHKLEQGTPRVTFEVQAPERLTAHLDPTRINQVVTNLLVNAQRYSPVGGTVVVTMTRNDADEVVIAVQDRGPGIPPERREQLFDRFHRAHGDSYSSGMGLGLYTCRKILELHGGRIEAEFPEEGGSRFIAIIPREPGHASRTISETPHA